VTELRMRPAASGPVPALDVKPQDGRSSFAYPINGLGRGASESRV
jgi:hypothetical protein